MLQWENSTYLTSIGKNYGCTKLSDCAVDDDDPIRLRYYIIRCRYCGTRQGHLH